MSSVSFGQLADEIARADSALLSGDPLLAGRICRQVLGRVDRGWAGPIFEGRLIRAVVTHRIGIAQYELGEDDEAAITFSRADELLGEAQQSVGDDEQDLIDLLVNTREISREQQEELARRPRETRFTCYAVCEHGCRCAITPCGYDSPHC
jgi:hypothetical protein